MSDFVCVRRPRARKLHECCECYGPIKSGDIYERVSGTYYGDMFEYTMCLRCAAMWSHAGDAFDWWDPEYRPALGDLRGTLRNEYDITDPDAWLDGRVALKEAATAQGVAMQNATSAYQGSFQ